MQRTDLFVILWCIKSLSLRSDYVLIPAFDIHDFLTIRAVFCVGTRASL